MHARVTRGDYTCMRLDLVEKDDTDSPHAIQANYIYIYRERVWYDCQSICDAMRCMRAVPASSVDYHNLMADTETVHAYIFIFIYMQYSTLIKTKLSLEIWMDRIQLYWHACVQAWIEYMQLYILFILNWKAESQWGGIRCSIKIKWKGS